MDQQGMRTLFMGLLAGFVIYGLSFVTRFFLPEPSATYWAIGLNIVSIVFTVGWFMAVRYGGFRLGKKTNRAERRAKDHLKGEQDKKRRLWR